MILALDTGTPYLALGLLHGEQASRWVQAVGRQHAERLPGALDELLAGRSLAGLRLIVVGTGPGSYTGLRVGASYALGLGRARGVPVVGLSTLEGLTARAGDGEVATSLDARKGQVYGAVFRVEGGAVASVIQAPRKLDRAEFAAQVAGRPWNEDTPPDPLVLARSGERRGATDWTLSYL